MCLPENRLKLSNLKHVQNIKQRHHHITLIRQNKSLFVFNPFKVNDRLASKEKGDFNTNCPLATSFNRGIFVSSFLFFHTSFHHRMHIGYIFLPLLLLLFLVFLWVIYFISGYCVFYFILKVPWHCNANKIYYERFYENQKENMKNINWSILMRLNCWYEKHQQKFYEAQYRNKRKENDEAPSV